MLEGLLLIILGALAAPNLFAKSPEAQKVIAKIAPYVGWFGIAAIVWGILRLLTLFSMFGLFGHGLRAMIFVLVYALQVGLLIVVGFLLGIGTLKMFIKDPNAQAKMDQTIAKISPYQGTLGLISIIVGVLLLIYFFVPTLAIG
jgi:hypothetical protein